MNAQNAYESASAFDRQAMNRRPAYWELDTTINLARSAQPAKQLPHPAYRHPFAALQHSNALKPLFRPSISPQAFDALMDSIPVTQEAQPAYGVSYLRYLDTTCTESSPEPEPTTILSLLRDDYETKRRYHLLETGEWLPGFDMFAWPEGPLSFTFPYRKLKRTPYEDFIFLYQHRFVPNTAEPSKTASKEVDNGYSAKAMDPSFGLAATLAAEMRKLNDYTINTEGGAYIAGDVHIHNGDFVGRDKFVNWSDNFTEQLTPYWFYQGKRQRWSGMNPQVNTQGGLYVNGDMHLFNCDFVNGSVHSRKSKNVS